MIRILAYIMVMMAALIGVGNFAARAQEMPVEVGTMEPPPLPGELPGDITLSPAGASGDDAMLAPEEIMLRQAAEAMRIELERLDKLDKGLPSLFFNNVDQARLQEAIGRYNEGPSPEELAAIAKGGGPGAPLGREDGFDVFEYARDIRLGGIVMQGGDDWIVWLNKQRLTPHRLPPEVRDIRVHKDYIELKWFDAQADKIVPIRLRPNQRFNLDARMFLPG